MTTSELLALGLAEFRRLDQPKVETEALRHVTQALEVAIAWVVDGGDSSRKRILGHNRGEPELLVESLLRDTGGQG